MAVNPYPLFISLPLTITLTFFNLYKYIKTKKKVSQHQFKMTQTINEKHSLKFNLKKKKKTN